MAIRCFPLVVYAWILVAGYDRILDENSFIALHRPWGTAADMTLFDTPDDLNALMQAKALLENPGFAARIIHLVGLPIEKGFALRIPGFFVG